MAASPHPDYAGFEIPLDGPNMPTNSTRFKPARKPIAIAVVGLILAQQNALAQTQAPETKPATTAETPAPKTDNPQKLETVVVTSGSRIKRDNYSSTAPLLVVKTEDAALAGYSSTAQVLQGTAVTGGQGQINNAFGGYVTDGGPGANTIGLRGFAPTRSLVLLNGRRMSPSGTRGSVGAADLNTLPNSIVDRIEVLKDGASSIYGSDAVAGVINIITKKDLTSIQVDGSASRTVDGGGNAYNFSLAGGFVTDRTRFLASYNYNAITGMTLAQRAWTTCNTDYRRTSVNGVVGDWGSADTIDPLTGKPKCYPITGTGSNGVTINTIGTNTLTGVPAVGATGTSFNRWRPNSSVSTGLVGFEGVGGGQTTNTNIRDTFDPRTLNRTLYSPVRNHNIYAQGGVDLGVLGDAELYYEVLLNRRESSQVGYRQLSLDYIKGSPLIPANLAGSTFSGPVNTSNGQNVGVRAFIGFGNDYSSQSVDFVRTAVGLRGAIPAFSSWDYDVSWTHAESRGSYAQQSFLTDRLANSLNVVASGSGFACANTSATGCVAAPRLTSAVIGGQLPQAWVDYVWQTVTGMTKYKEDVVTGSVTGSLFKLPYGDVKGAFGAEFRKNKIDDTPSLDSQNNNLYNLTSSAPTRGSDQATDFFGEIEVPVLKNLPLAKELTVNASTRYADYKSYGSDSTYKFGAIWAPASWITLRGSNGTSYRAPALYEQFLGATTGFLSNQNDPCNNWDNPAQAGTPRAVNCKSEGLPAGFQATSSITVVNSGGRAAGLKAETSKNASWGVVLQPELPTGWGTVSLAVDRFDLVVDNGVSRAGTANILQRCYDSPGFRQAGGFCRLVDARNTTSNALTVNDSYVNLATDIARGFDYTAQYTNEIGSGKLKIDLTVTEYRSQAYKLFADDALDDNNGNVGTPKWSGQLDVKYNLKNWGAYYSLEWVDKTSSYAYYGEDPATSRFKLNTPSYFLHSASVSYNDSVNKWKATIGVRNLFDKKPPVISSGVYNRVGNAPLYSGYDYLGRRLFVNVSKTF